MLGPFLNTVCQFFIMHYLNISGRTLRGFRRGPLWECNYENNLSHFNLSSLGSGREAACSKLFNNMCIPSHKLHHLVLQRQTNPDITSGNQVPLMFFGVYVELWRCSQVVEISSEVFGKSSEIPESRWDVFGNPSHDKTKILRVSLRKLFGRYTEVASL